MARDIGIQVWDIGVRIFHWSLVVLFFTAYLSADDESTLHAYAGYGVLALVAFRLIWGIVGTKHARFAGFLCGPKATLQYVQSMLLLRAPRYVGHNPLGGWMVVTLLVFLTATCWSGLEAYAQQGRGPLAAEETVTMSSAMADEGGRVSRGRRDNGGRDEKSSEFWDDIHEALSNITLFLVIVHVIGVVIASVMHRENLVKAMITGFKVR